MNLEEFLLYSFGMLLCFSVPICMMIFLFNVEVMPNIIRYGWSLDIIGQIIHIIIVSTVLGFLVELFFSELYLMIKN